MATGREFQDLVYTRTNPPSCCLAAGRGVSLWAPGNGGVFASKRAWPASGVGATTPPCRCRLLAPNRSFLGSPGPRPGHGGGSSGDIVDTGLEQQAWPGAARAVGRWRTSGGLCSPGRREAGGGARGRARGLPGSLSLCQEVLGVRPWVTRLLPSPGPWLRVEGEHCPARPPGPELAVGAAVLCNGNKDKNPNALTSSPLLCVSSGRGESACLCPWVTH